MRLPSDFAFFAIQNVMHINIFCTWPQLLLNLLGPPIHFSIRQETTPECLGQGPMLELVASPLADENSVPPCAQSSTGQIRVADYRIYNGSLKILEVGQI